MDADQDPAPAVLGVRPTLIGELIIGFPVSLVAGHQIGDAFADMTGNDPVLSVLVVMPVSLMFGVVAGLLVFARWRALTAH